MRKTVLRLTLLTGVALAASMFGTTESDARTCYGPRVSNICDVPLHTARPRRAKRLAIVPTQTPYHCATIELSPENWNALLSRSRGGECRWRAQTSSGRFSRVFTTQSGTVCGPPGQSWGITIAHHQHVRIR